MEKVGLFFVAVALLLVLVGAASVGDQNHDRIDNRFTVVDYTSELFMFKLAGGSLLVAGVCYLVAWWQHTHPANRLEGHKYNNSHHWWEKGA